MVQEFMILRCFSCTTFQVHQVKKSKKWVCKVCGEKQSVKKVYAQGSGQDCRKHVQKLNMKCGEAQKAKDLASDSEELSHNDYCDFSENTHIIAVNDENSKNTNHEDHTGLTKGDSKWEKFLELNASDDNGSEDFVGFNVTTERDVFDKVSSRGKRKSVWQHGKSSTNHRGKRSKKSSNWHEDQINASDMHWIDSDNASGNTFSDVKHFRQNTGPRLQNPSAHTLVNFDSTSDQKHCNKYQSPSNRVLPPYGDLRLNPQTSHNECNIYFAKATRDPTPVNKNMPSRFMGEQASSSSSKWAKFMSSSSSSQDELHETTTENNSQPYFVTPDMHHDDSRCNHKTILSSRQGSGSQDSQYNCVPTSNTTIDDSKTKSLLGQDLFKVDDDLDGEWWDSL